MSDSEKKKKMDVREKVTLTVSLVVVLTAIIYWSIQVGGVMEMLEMAYG